MVFRTQTENAANQAVWDKQAEHTQACANHPETAFCQGVAANNWMAFGLCCPNLTIYGICSLFSSGHNGKGIEVSSLGKPGRKRSNFRSRRPIGPKKEQNGVFVKHSPYVSAAKWQKWCSKWRCRLAHPCLFVKMHVWKVRMQSCCFAFHVSASFIPQCVREVENERTNK